ncbi:unnamed protein product [Rotaria sp. Silwood1]|nr:unnamed protein product [Rotaria sp. Silwood1]CAF1427160.1 unnamed protein product [Rotaria sp. Silwood1]CAF3552258.1 unnamed protein product [Rotaria sp. Silwood1]CAF4910758.1 unnamed protein product [Rotaria sp. Silwood1]
MVLVINGHEYSKQCSLEDLKQYNDLIKVSCELASSDELKQPIQEISQTIYVYQREFAVIGKNDRNGFHLIGSDNATTCHILVLDNQVAVALAHLDGGETRQSIENMLQELTKYAPENTEYDVYIVGGFLDETRRQYSRNLSNEILYIFSTKPNITFHLKLAAITIYNDHIVDDIHYPHIYGICFDINTKNIRKMVFIDNGPGFRLRTVYQTADSHPAWCIYSSLEGKLTIKKFDIDRNSVVPYYKHLYKYFFHNNQQLLAMTSTSPEQERDTFIKNMKKTILYIITYYKDIPKWFDEQTHSIIYYHSNDEWITDNKKIIDDIEIK